MRGNVRTAAAAMIGLDPALRVAFNTGSVMGFMVVGFGLSGLSLVFLFLQAISEEGKASEVPPAAAPVGCDVFDANRTSRVWHEPTENGRWLRDYAHTFAAYV